MSLFTDLLADPGARKRWLVIAQPFDPDLAATRTFYWSDDGFTSAPADTPANTWFEPRLDETFAYRFKRTLVGGRRLGGRSIPDAGTLALNALGGGIDTLLRMGWDNRPIQVLLGGEDFALADFGTVFNGQSIAASSPDGGRTIQLALRDLGTRFQVPMLRTFYGGSGGSDGGANLKGKGRPICLGEVFNAELVVEDRANLKLRAHLGAGEDVPALRGAGSPLTKVGGAPTAGQYSVDVSTMTVTLGGSPVGGALITADIKGDKTGGTWRVTVADLVRHVAETYPETPLVWPGDFDTAAFAALNTACPYAVGLWIPDGSQALIADVLDALVNAVGGTWGINRAGKLTVGRIGLPSGSAVASYGAREIFDLKPLAAVLPVARQTVGYKRNWRVQSDAELAGITWTNGTRDGFMTEYLVTDPVSVAATLTKHPLAKDDRWDTLLRDAADANAVRDFLSARDGVDQQWIDAVVRAQLLARDIGDEVRLTDDRFELAAGGNFMVAGIDDSNSLDCTLTGFRNVT